MTKRDKKRFIRELIDNVKQEIIGKVDRMPDEWDGHELRRFIADRFSDAAYTLGPGSRGFTPSGRRRYRAYRNEVLTRNL